MKSGTADKKPLIHKLADALRYVQQNVAMDTSEMWERMDDALTQYDEWKAGSESWKTVAEPKVFESGCGTSGEQRIVHPAFATIGISRISGMADLFGSYVGHQHYISLRISPATLYRDGYSERVHGGIDRYIEVAMSEAQWAAVIGSANVGSGVPCTLQHLSDPGEWYRGIPRLPQQQKAAERMSEQARDMVARSRERAKAALARLEPLIAKLPKKDQAAMQGIIDTLAGESKANLEFQHKCLTETQEKLVSEAKVNIDAMVQHVAARFGVASVERLGQILASDPHAAMQLLAGPPSHEGES